MGPWLDEEAHRNKPQVTASINLLDCDDCRKRNKRRTRQMFGCGFEERIASAQPWAPSGLLKLTKGKRPETCIGYTRRLPLAQETTWDVVHWDQGSLALAYEEITPEHWDRMKAYKSALGHVREWAFENPPKKPGRP